MADLTPLGFNPAEVESMGDGFTVVPPGIYTVIAIESTVKDTSKGGKLLEYKYQIVDGAHTGTSLTDRINIVNSSETSQKIGMSQLKDICEAVGFTGDLKDSSQLHGKPFAVKVTVEEFESNKQRGKMLKSNRVEKRMSKAAAATLAPVSASAPGQQKQAMGWG